MLVAVTAAPMRVQLGSGLLFRTTKSFTAPQHGRWLHHFVSGTISPSPMRCGGRRVRNQPLLQQSRCMSYIPMTEQEEEEEKKRVSRLTDLAKEQELRKLNREISRLEMLKGINTGARYTMRGQYAQLARDYGIPLAVYWWAVYGVMLGASYLTIEFGGIDVMNIMFKLDGWTGYDISGSVKPEYGKIGLAIALNEFLEPIRLPFVVFTVKPVVDTLFPGKY